MQISATSCTSTPATVFHWILIEFCSYNTHPLSFLYPFSPKHDNTCFFLAPIFPIVKASLFLKLPLLVQSGGANDQASCFH
jgi:hypothetical protein